MHRISSITAFSLLIFWATSAFAEPNDIGYSGAPGRQNCASSCHGSGTGTVSVIGFPDAYTPNQMYLIALNHAGGSSIKNFNASCRVGTGSTNAGTITSGFRTVTYNTTGETNGIHLSQNDRDSCNFSWTAPGAGTGVVRLYVAAHQGGENNGPNTDVELIASEAVEPQLPDQATNPFPANFATEVSPSVTLTWDAAAGTEFYDVFFAPMSPPWFVGSQTTTTYDPPGNLDVGMAYYWRIDTRNDSGTTTGEEWQFTTSSLPPQVENPFPEDGAIDVPLNTHLSWSPSPGAWWYNVYWGTTNPPPYITFQAETTYTLDGLNADMTYYWKITSGSSGGESEGQLWQFTTLSDLPPDQAVNPSPADLALDVPLPVTLSWDAVDNADYYILFFGPTHPPALLDSLNVTNYIPDGVSNSTAYFWKVNTVNTVGTTEGDLWQFTTEQSNASGESPALPTATTLGTPYPNPFNAETTIPFELAAAQHVTLTIYDLMGREVAQLADGEYPSGKYSLKWNSNTTASGVYLVRMNAGSEVYVAKLLALK